MTSYGESQPPRARAGVPGSGASAPDDSSRSLGSARPAPDAYRRGSGGRAPVGSASVGAAKVGANASAGVASVGKAPGIAGSASVGGAAAPVRGRAEPRGGGRGGARGRGSGGEGAPGWAPGPAPSAPGPRWPAPRSGPGWT